MMNIFNINEKYGPDLYEYIIAMKDLLYTNNPKKMISWKRGHKKVRTNEKK